MAEREFSKISGLPVAIEPIEPTTIVEIETADGQSFKAPFSALGGMPGSHASTHQDGGSDEIGTDSPTANAIPKADDDGLLNDWIADASTSVKGKVQLATDGEVAASKAVQANDARLSNSRTPTAHAASHIGGTDDLGLGTAALLNVGVADGVCGLDSSGLVGSSFLPSYVDDVIEVANFAALPATGETGKIYVTLDDNLTYRWSGSAYVEISKSLALGETSSTAYRGDRGKIAYDHSQAAHAPSNADNTQGAINGAKTKATPVDADVFGFLDSAASYIIKKMTAANVKAWLKAYFDTLYTSSGGDTPKNILAKLLTVDGAGSGLDADLLNGLTSYNFSRRFVFSGEENSVDLDNLLESGFYHATDDAFNTTTFIHTPVSVGRGGFGLYLVRVGSGYCYQVYKPYGGNNDMYVRSKWYSEYPIWTPWSKMWNEGNVGSGWTTALAASRYSMGTRVASSQNITTGEYIIPEGEYYVQILGTLNGTTGHVQMKYSSGVFYNFMGIGLAANEQMWLGYMRSDGSNIKISGYGGSMNITLLRIG